MNKIASWAVESAHRCRSEGWGGVVESAKPVYKKSLHKTLRFSGGTSIYDREWDLLIVLDACRMDLLQSVVDEYDYLQDVKQFRSVESATRHWMRETFSRENAPEMAQTDYLCGNPHSDTTLKESDFSRLEELWKTCWSDDLGTLPARAITDRAIEIGRSENPDRMILHYMQPHCPFINAKGFQRKKQADDWKHHDGQTDVWTELEHGHVTKPEVWEDYRNNLRHVLDDVEILLSNYDAENVVITSDHGNALGEWGLYGHPAHMPFNCLRSVPWAETTAKDTGEHAIDDHETKADSDTQDRLEALGYM